MKPNKPAVKNSTAAIHIQQQLHSGPLPSPFDFQQYDIANPGTAERILIMAEEEQRHRHAIEKNISRDNSLMVAERRRGQWMAFAIAVLLPAIGAYLIVNGYSITGSLLGTAGLVPVIYAFIPKNSKRGGS